jgi:IPT/TIG domain
MLRPKSVLPTAFRFDSNFFHSYFSRIFTMNPFRSTSSVSKRLCHSVLGSLCVIALCALSTMSGCKSSTDIDTPRIVTTAGNGGSGSGSGSGITQSAPPVIQAFTPTSGAVGTAVTILGSGFRGTTLVSFGGFPASSFTVVSDTQIVAVVGTQATTGTIFVSTSLGTATLAGFTVVPPGGIRPVGVPTITSFTPATAVAGQTVTITGTNFAGVTSVRFGGIPVASFTVISPTQITAVLGTGASGGVSVTTPGGTATSPGFTFIPAPTITLFTPASARAGTQVTITGTGFTGASAVSFGGVLASQFTVVSATQIIATVGTGATGNVSVTSPGGTGTRTGFTLLP